MSFSIRQLGVDVNLEIPDSLEHKVRVALQGSELPDVDAGRHRPSIRLTVRSADDGLLLQGNDGPAVRLRDETEALTHLLARINAAALASVPYFAIHAGAVAGNGRVIAIPAESGIGKSTLVAACLVHGMHYVSDEALCVTWEQGSIIPYPRPIALSQASRRILGLDADAPVETVIGASAIGASIARQPLRLAHVVLLDRSDSPLREVPRNVGVAEILRRSFNHWRAPQRAFELVHEMLETAAVWRLGRHAPQKSARLVADLSRMS